MRVSVIPTGLSPNIYTGTVTITPTSGQGVTPIQVQVTLVVADVIYHQFLGVIKP